MKTELSTTEVTINREQKLFVIPCNYGDEIGYSCLGFEVCDKRRKSLAKELKQDVKEYPIDSIESYNEYQQMIGLAATKHQLSGGKWKSKTELQKELIGHEGRKIAAVDSEGYLHVFRVGRSTGFIPCHLEIEEGEHGGGTLYLDLYKQWQFVD